MKFTLYNDANEFSDKVLPVIAHKDDVFSLFLGVLESIKNGAYEKPFMATIEHEGKVIALFQMTPPHPVNMIYLDESHLDACMELLIKTAIEENIKFSSIISMKSWAKRFAEKWKNETGLEEQLLMDQGLYRLDAVNEQLKDSLGKWRLAVEKDCELIQNWYHLFEQDTSMPMSHATIVKERVQKFVKAREVFLWEDEGKVVSMMKKSRPTKNGITVSMVFTPKEERRKGYARTLVAAVSKELLKEYNFCMLYTDLLNPTSNKIYQEIGYRKIADSVHIGFVNK
ncbi:GNAT family N-acetyltransferase [Sporosarcina pasteurii]|uniref:Predicted acetyltransferase n=1 Tax=Sporosarcina pasteurii TaxID=1474 RepID=A0A380C8W4_SPOPA|nr:GNAT family N-acetyltransferase [Sporosarcina pasteurii]MDS9473070.1 GNAT family N-acetyltransferase [Sporosarcina pasteurii]QBQ04576.1 GNAT family N-acetyltransferase [Sporosarcina pasteurii]SUJ14156.1 Predicted acetyltransferase [Sporosarcina pasteurii]